MWPFKSKFDKLKREDVVEAICTLEKQEADIETGITERAKQINDLMEKGRKEKSRELRLFYAKKINDLKEENESDVKRGMYLLYNVKLLRKLKTSIDDNTFFANTGKVSLGNLLADQRGLAVFLNKALNTRVQGENVLTAADEVEYNTSFIKYVYSDAIYRARVYDGIGKPDSSAGLVYGPNIADWPKMEPLKENLLLKVASVLTDPVTTTDELIPSGETSSYRSNPMKLAEFALSRKDPGYVSRAKAIAAEAFPAETGAAEENTTYGSVVCAVRPGDGSAREQAASCQRVLGGAANIAVSYATKRYRSNVINWGMLPFTAAENDFAVGELVYVPDVKKKLLAGETEFPAKVFGENAREIVLKIDPLTEDEKKIIAAGCLINFYAAGN